MGERAHEIGCGLKHLIAAPEVGGLVLPIHPAEVIRTVLQGITICENNAERRFIRDIIGRASHREILTREVVRFFGLYVEEAKTHPSDTTGRLDAAQQINRCAVGTQTNAPREKR